MNIHLARPRLLGGVNHTSHPKVKASKSSSLQNYASTKAQSLGTKLMHEIDLHAISDKDQSERMLTLSDGAALFLASEQKSYGLDDPYVNDVAFRKQIGEELSRDIPANEQIRFVESAGVAEPGVGYFATVPVFSSYGATLTLGFGFSLGAILRYRSSLPIIAKKHKHEKIALHSLKTLPVHPEAARRMCAGQEFEICGQARARADANVGVRYGADAALALLGAACTAGANAFGAHELSLTVISLNGDNLVRIIIRKIEQKSAGVSLSLAAGLIIPANSLASGNIGVPQFGHGMLRFLTENAQSGDFESLLNDLSTLSISTKRSKEYKSTEIYAYDLDLNMPSAHDAYNALVRFDFKEAEMLATRKGISKIELGEKQITKRANQSLNLLGQKLFMRERANSRSKGHLIDDLGNLQRYRDNVYKKESKNCLTGNREITWESVQIKKAFEERKTFFHFSYQREVRRAKKRSIADFFAFADKLGLHYEKPSKEHGDDRHISLDVYILPAGVERFLKTSKEELQRLFLLSCAELKPELKAHPMLGSDTEIKKLSKIIFESYREKKKHKIHMLSKLKHEYFLLCARNLKIDYRAFHKAKKFAYVVQKEKTKKLFSSLAKSKKFDYQEIISALAKLAGQENLIVEALTESSKASALALMHPREEGVALCLRSFMR